MEFEEDCEETIISQSTSGYIYLLYDTAFPEHLKVGRTINPFSRLDNYNANKPYKTAKYLYLSNPICNINVVEYVILQELYKQTTKTSDLNREWFEYKDLPIIQRFIENYLILEKEDEELFKFSVEMFHSTWDNIATQEGKAWVNKHLRSMVNKNWKELRSNMLIELANYKFTQ